MENNTFHTSFIPKKPVVSNGRPMRPRRSFNLLSFLTTIVIIFVIATAAGLYFYKDYLNKEIASKSASLNLTKDRLEEGTLRELQNFNKRLSSSKQILSSHIVISPFFELLESITLPEVQFTGFNGALSKEGKGFAVSMGGLAKDYRTVAVQSDIFNGELAKDLNDVSFTNLTLSDEKNTKGFVSFNVSFFVDPSFISFENNLLEKKENSVNTEVQNPDSTNAELQNITPEENSQSDNKGPDLSANKEDIQ